MFSDALQKLGAQLRQTRDLVRVLRHGPRSEMTRVQGIAARNLRTLFLVARWEVVDRVKLHAQALTFDTVLALVPLLAVVFAVVKGFGGMQNVGDRIEALIVSNIAGSPEIQAVIAEHIHDFVANTHTGNIGAISIVILVFSVMSLLGHIEFAINAIFGTRPQRSLAVRLLTYWAILTLGPVLLGASFALTAALQSSSVAAAMEKWGVGSRVVVGALPITVSWIALTIMYLVVPATRVRLSAALPAAIVAGSLWSGAKLGYAIYVKKAITLQNIYGSLAAIPLFILWLYVSWLLVLIGAQLAFAFQNAATYRPESDHSTASFATRERAACRLMLEVACDFFTGRPPTDLDQAADALALPRRLLTETAQQLRAGGFVRETEPSGGLVPALALEKVTVDAVLCHLRSSNGGSTIAVQDPAWRYIEELAAQVDQARERIVGGTNFRDLAARFASEPAPTRLAGGSARGAGSCEDQSTYARGERAAPDAADTHVEGTAAAAKGAQSGALR